MPAESIVFSPDLDERRLDREVGKIDKRLEDAASDIQADISADLDSMTPAGVSGGGGAGRVSGGVGGGAAAGAAGLASKIPKPVAGVAVASALPVALGGAVGVGMLSAMQGASARLQTSASLMGQAWTQVWRPFGDKLDEMLVRPVAEELLEETTDFNEFARKEGLGVAVASLASGVEGSLAGAIGDNVEGAFETIGVDANIGGEVSTFLQEVDWLSAMGGTGAFSAEIGEALVDTIGAPTINPSDIMNRIGWPSITGAAVVGSLAFNPVTAPLLVSALTFERVTGTDLLEETFGGISINEGDLLSWITGGGRNSGGSGGGGNDDLVWWENTGEAGRPSRTGDTTDSSTSRTGMGTVGGGDEGSFAETGPVAGPTTSTGLQRGGVVTRRSRTTVAEAGPEVVQPLSEFRRMVEGVAREASRSGGDTDALERKVERMHNDLHRDLKRLNRMLSQLSIEVDGERFGRLTTKTRHSQVFDSDPLA